MLCFFNKAGKSKASQKMTTSSLLESNIAFKLNRYKTHIVQLSYTFKKPLKEYLLFYVMVKENLLFYVMVNGKLPAVITRG